MDWAGGPLNSSSAGRGDSSAARARAPSSTFPRSVPSAGGLPDAYSVGAFYSYPRNVGEHPCPLASGLRPHPRGFGPCPPRFCHCADPSDLGGRDGRLLSWCGLADAGRLGGPVRDGVDIEGADGAAEFSGVALRGAKVGGELGG